MPYSAPFPRLIEWEVAHPFTWGQVLGLLKAMSETKAKIVELNTQLEVNNPMPTPTEALTLLNEKWILV